MRPPNDALAEDLLTCARLEFLHKGYRAASVRGIAARANATTGALYRYYDNKAALFDALVAEPAEKLIHLFTSCTTPPETGVDSSADAGYQFHCLSRLVEFIYRHYDAFKLIVSCSEGTKYEHYLEELIELETAAVLEGIEDLKEKNALAYKIDEGLIHIIVSTLLTGVFEIIDHDIPMDEAAIHMRALQDFYTAGWNRLLLTGKASSG